MEIAVNIIEITKKSTNEIAKEASSYKPPINVNGRTLKYLQNATVPPSVPKNIVIQKKTPLNATASNPRPMALKNLLILNPPFVYMYC